MKNLFLVIIFVALKISSVAQSLPKEGALCSTDGKYVLVIGDSITGSQLDTNNILSIIYFNKTFPAINFKNNLNLSKDSIDKILESEAYRKYVGNLWYNYHNFYYQNHCLRSSWLLYSCNNSSGIAKIISTIINRNDSVFVMNSNESESLLPMFIVNENCDINSFPGFPQKFTTWYKTTDFLKKYNLSAQLEDHSKYLTVKVDTLKIERQQWYDKDYINRYIVNYSFLVNKQTLLIDKIENNGDSPAIVLIDNESICPLPLSTLFELGTITSDMTNLYYNTTLKFYFLKTGIQYASRSYEIKKNTGEDDRITEKGQVEISNKVACGHIKE